MGPSRVWCQWWNAGVEINHSSGPKRQRISTADGHTRAQFGKAEGDGAAYAAAAAGNKRDRRGKRHPFAGG